MLLTPDDTAIASAADALRSVITRTPLLESLEANRKLGGRLLIKAENMQRTGAFKIRGAYNRMRMMTANERSRGVVTYSSGNHALGVAVAAAELGSSSVIVMPSDAPEQKIQQTKAMGAIVVTYDRDTEKSSDTVERFMNEEGRIHLPPSGQIDVHAGAATVPIEILEQADEIGAEIDFVLIPCGGGGLTAMTAYMFAKHRPGSATYAVEPENFDDTTRSLAAGHRVGNVPGARTICDSIMTPTPNEHTFAVNQEHLAGGLVVSDSAVLDAMRFVFEHFKMIVEPGAAVGVAAVLSDRIDIKNRTIVTVATGGNISADRYCKLFRGITG